MTFGVEKTFKSSQYLIQGKVRKLDVNKVRFEQMFLWDFLTNNRLFHVKG